MKRLNRWICLIVGLWRSLRAGVVVCGCDLVEEIHDKPAFVSVCRCEMCGKYVVAWSECAIPSSPEVQG